VLAALDSGRWTIEPGASTLISHGEGLAHKNALGLVRELRVRDWINADGTVTLAGRRLRLRHPDRRSVHARRPHRVTIAS
jgi:hypothetical protein